MRSAVVEGSTDRTATSGDFTIKLTKLKPLLFARYPMFVADDRCQAGISAGGDVNLPTNFEPREASSRRRPCVGRAIWALVRRAREGRCNENQWLPLPRSPAHSSCRTSRSVACRPRTARHGPPSAGRSTSASGRRPEWPRLRSRPITNWRLVDDPSPGISPESGDRQVLRGRTGKLPFVHRRGNYRTI